MNRIHGIAFYLIRLFTVALVATLAPCVNAAMFTGLGFLPGHDQIGEFPGPAISADGKVAVGTSGSVFGPSNAFRWTMKSGIERLGISEAADVSADGGVVVGSISPGVGANGFPIRDGYRWAQGNAENLGAVDDSRAWSVSADGSVVVGQTFPQPGRPEPFRWTAEDGIFGLAVPRFSEEPPLNRSSALKVSGDGSVIVGMGSDESTAKGMGRITPIRHLWRRTPHCRCSYKS